MSTQPLAFTGISQFSEDFQTILSRAVSIASLPVQSLQNDQVDILTQKQLLTNLNGAVASVGEAIEALGALGANQAVVGTSSNTAKVTINSTNASSPATYTISEITSVARSASAATAGFIDGDSAAVSATGTVRLTFDGTDYTINLDPDENSLGGLRDKINNLGAGVTATVLTTGTGPAPFYLSITANATGLKPIALVDDPLGAATNLVATSDNGADAVFKVNGVAVTKSSNLINDVVSGLSFTIVATTAGDTVALTLATDRTKISTALKNLVGAYNAAKEQTSAQIGPAAGLLTGDFIIREAENALRSAVTFAGTDSIRNIGDLGVQFSSTGQASFDQATFDALSGTQIEDAFAFFGSETTGFGALSARFSQITDPVTGLIKVQQDQYDKTDKSLSEQIVVLNERVAALRLSLSARLQAADALLAQLESQQSILDASIESLNLVLYGRSDQ